jgi:hypothetical protein
MASPEPFIPRVLRSVNGTVAVEMSTLQSGGVPELFRIVHAGQDLWVSPLGATGWRSQGFTHELLTSYLHMHELTP